MGKSAQFPLHVWLPDAMEGPTPVSALIHAATMVNAGVYMIARSYPLVSHSHTAMLVVMIVGTFTAIYAACIALTQNDIKKVIAYSTISSLGFMFMALGAGAWVAAIFYLFAHGFFKGLLFLGSGSVIHSMSGEQDMRLMGGLRKKLPLTFWTMLVGALANVGLFPFAGFWAKDEILGGDFARALLRRSGSWASSRPSSPPCSCSASCSSPSGARTAPSAEVQDHIHESPRVMTVPLVILAVPAAMLGLVVGLPPDGGWLHTLPAAGVLRRREGALRLGRQRRRAHGGLARRRRCSASTRPTWPTCGGPSCRRGPPPACRGPTRPRTTSSTWTSSTTPPSSVRSWPSPCGCGRSSTSRSSTARSTASPRPGARFGRALRPLQTGRAQSYAFGVFAGLFVLIILIRYFWGA